MFERTYEIRYGDYKDFETIKTSCILDLVQDISIRHSNELGYSLTKLRDMNIAWLMQGICMHFDSPAKTSFPVKMYTDVKSMRGATSQRGCIITQNGEEVGRTVASWFTFDTAKMKPCRIPAQILNAYPCHDFGNDFFDFKKPELFRVENPQYYIKVANNDLDTNKHLNNQKSAEMLMDALPFDFNFTDASIFYKNPAYLGDGLGVCVKETSNGYYVHLEDKEKNVCVAGEFEIH